MLHRDSPSSAGSNPLPLPSVSSARRRYILEHIARLVDEAKDHRADFETLLDGVFNAIGYSENVKLFANGGLPCLPHETERALLVSIATHANGRLLNRLVELVSEHEASRRFYAVLEQDGIEGVNMDDDGTPESTPAAEAA